MNTHPEIPCKDTHPPESRPKEGSLFVEGGCRLCWLAVNNERYKALWTGQPIPPRPPEPLVIRTDHINRSEPVRRAGGVGTALKRLLSVIGINPAGCRCDERARLMDGWGIEGCREKKDEIVSWLRGEYRKIGWAAVLRSVVSAIATGLAFKLSPLDPVPDLVDEAIRRAEEVEKSRGV